MNPQIVDTYARFGNHGREAICKRLAELAIALGHPRLTAKQAAALLRERKELDHTLAAGDVVDRPVF